MTDEALILAYLEGDDRALEQLIDRYLTDVFNFAFKLTVDQGMAEDITQESFIKVWKNIRQYEVGHSFRSWLFRITRNTAIDYLRKKKDLVVSRFVNEEGENILAETVSDRSMETDILISQAENFQFVEKILKELNPKYKDVMVLRSTSNMTFEEIAKTLKCPLHTVKSQYRRALANLRRLYKGETL